MVSTRTSIFLVLATLFGGLMAGMNVDRAIVAMPAWQKVGPLAWGVFSQDADLGNGLFLYPFTAFAGFFLSVAAALSYRAEKNKNRTGIWMTHLAAFLALCGLLMTIKAAPIMLSVPHLGNDVVALQKAFDGFEFWGGIRGIFQVMAFVANLLAILGALLFHPALKKRRVH